MIRHLGATLLIFLLLTSSVHALDMPALCGYVNDTANMIPAATELKLEQYLENFERSDSTQLVVLTLPSLEGEDLAETAIRVATNWQLGQQGKDNGLLLLIAKQERKIRIEVGSGLEGGLTDLLAGRIIDLEITPRLRQGNIPEGVIAGVLAMTKAIRGEYTGTGSSSKKKERGSLGWLTILLFLAPGLLPFGRRRRSMFWMGGGYGGGFGGGGGGGFSGGGGSFGGGGASGGW